MSNSTVLAFDIGRTGAWYVSNYDRGEEIIIDSLLKFERLLKELIQTYKPDIILYPHPVQYYNVMRKHWQIIGVINLVAEKKEIQTIEVKDSQAKKLVFGKGKVSKEEIKSNYEEESEHLADAKMFVESYFLSVS